MQENLKKPEIGTATNTTIHNGRELRYDDAQPSMWGKVAA